MPVNENEISDFKALLNGASRDNAADAVQRPYIIGALEVLSFLSHRSATGLSQ